MSRVRNAAIIVSKERALDSIIDAIVPNGIVTAEVFGDVAPIILFPEEEAIVRHAVEKRRREFRAGRWLARQALQRLGHSAVPLLSGPRREPIWPDGVVGSITHCSGYCAVALGRGDAFLTIGVDAEPSAPLPEEVLPSIASEDERGWIESQAADGTCWDRLLFSAKESVFKAWFPVMHRWLDFRGARVRFEPLDHTFHVELLGDALRLDTKEVHELHGSYHVHRGLVLTAVVISAAQPTDHRMNLPGR